MLFSVTRGHVGVWPCWKKACYTFNLKQRDQFILQRDLMLSIKSSPALTLIPYISLYLINNSEYLCHVFGNYIYCCECRFKIFKLLLLSMVSVRQQIMWK